MNILPILCLVVICPDKERACFFLRAAFFAFWSVSYFSRTGNISNSCSAKILRQHSAIFKRLMVTFVVCIRANCSAAHGFSSGDSRIGWPDPLRSCRSGFGDRRHSSLDKRRNTKDLEIRMRMKQHTSDLHRLRKQRDDERAATANYQEVITGFVAQSGVWWTVVTNALYAKRGLFL